MFTVCKFCHLRKIKRTNDHTINVKQALLVLFCLLYSDQIIPSESFSSTQTIPDNSDTQPTIDLNISLSELWPGCSTVLVDVTPWCLFTNLSDLDLVLMGSEDRTFRVSQGNTISPPKIEVKQGYSAWLYMKYLINLYCKYSTDPLFYSVKSINELMNFHSLVQIPTLWWELQEHVQYLGNQYIQIGRREFI